MSNHVEFALHARTNEVRDRIAKRWENIAKMQRSLERQVKQVTEMEQVFNERVRDRGDFFGPEEEEF